MQEIETVPPGHLRDWWTQDLWCLHSAAWWRRHWERTGIVDVQLADDIPDGWRLRLGAVDQCSRDRFALPMHVLFQKLLQTVAQQLDAVAQRTLAETRGCELLPGTRGWSGLTAGIY